MGVIFAVALILLSYSLKYDSGAGFVKKLVLEAAAPVQKFFSASLEGVGNAWTRYIALVGLEEENRSLKSKIAGLQAELILYKEASLEVQRLQKLLSIQNEYSYNFIAARVIGSEQAALSKAVWLNKGSMHGLKPGMPVIVQPGLIGRLTDVSWHTSKVLLLTDENSNIDVLIQRTRVQGIVRGAGSRGCLVKYISKIQDVKEGDTVVTSGMSNFFPKGLLLGKVSHVDRLDVGLFLQIRVTPFVDFSTLEEVLVLTAEPKETAPGKKTAKMIFYLLLPLAAIILVVLQTTLADIFFSGWLSLELSLVVVIYAGFHLELTKGMLLAFVMGFVFDCLSGSVMGLFTMIYLLIFVFSFFVSLRIASEKLSLIAWFSLIVSLLESLALFLLYHFVFEFDMLNNVLFVFVPQALLISVLSVGFFYLMRKARRIDVWKNIAASATDRIQPNFGRSLKSSLFFSGWFSSFC